MTFDETVMIISHETEFLHNLMAETGLLKKQLRDVATKSQHWKTGHAIVLMTNKRSLSLLMSEFKITSSLAIRIADSTSNIARDQEFAQAEWIQTPEIRLLHKFAIFIDWIKEVVSDKVTKKLFSTCFPTYVEEFQKH